METQYFSGSMPLHASKHRFNAYGVSESLNSTTIFNTGKTSSGGQEHCILKTHFELPYTNNDFYT